MTYQSGDQKDSLGSKVVDMMVRVFIMAAFLLLVTPMFIAPMLGITPADYASNEIYWTLISLALGWVVAIPFARLITRSIKKSGGGI